MQKQLLWFVHTKVCFDSQFLSEVSDSTYLSYLYFAHLFTGNKMQKTVIPVTSLKAGDEVLLRLQGGARHTGIEIQEFIVEN